MSLTPPLNRLRTELFNGGCFEFLYDLKEEIGKGAFAVVKMAVHRKSGEKVAVKFIHKKMGNKTQREEVEAEVDILTDCSALENIVQLKEVFETSKFYILVMELITGGQLFDAIIEKKQLLRRRRSSRHGPNSQRNPPSSHSLHRPS